MKPIGENMNIAQKKDRIDELEVEIEKLKDASGKMLARQVTSRADLQSEYETGAKLVAEALQYSDIGCTVTSLSPNRRMQADPQKATLFIGGRCWALGNKRPAGRELRDVR